MIRKRKVQTLPPLTQ